MTIANTTTSKKYDATQPQAALVAFIKQQILASEAWLLRSIVAIFCKQTQSEQTSETTKELNGVGFNGADAEILSSFAKHINNGRKLSEKQIALARRKMVKYARQLDSIAQEKKA